MIVVTEASVWRLLRHLWRDRLCFILPDNSFLPFPQHLRKQQSIVSDRFPLIQDFENRLLFVVFIKMFRNQYLNCCMHSYYIIKDIFSRFRWSVYFGLRNVNLVSLVSNINEKHIGLHSLPLCSCKFINVLNKGALFLVSVQYYIFWYVFCLLG